METIRVEFSLRPEDAVEANELHRKRSKVHRYLMPFWIFLCLTLYYSYQAWHGAPEGNPIGFCLGLFFSALLMIPGLQLFRWTNQKLVESVFRREGTGQKSHCYEISDEKIHMSGADYESSVKWSLFTGWVEGEKIFALFHNRMVYAIPKRRLGSETQDQLRTLITQKLGPN